MDASTRRTEKRTGRMLAGTAVLMLATTACSSGGDGGMQPTGAVAAQDAPIASGTVWVTDRAHNDVAAFDTRTGALLARVPVGKNPIGVVAPPHLRKLYVSNEDSNTVSVVSKDSPGTPVEVPIATPDAKPHHLTASPDGRFVYVAEFGSHRVAVIDTGSDTVVREYEAGADRAKTHAVGVSPNGRTLYAVNSGTNEVVALDAGTGERRWSLAVGVNPSEILVAPGGDIGYVTIRGENSVRVVDLRNPRVIDTIGVGPEPDTLQLTNDGTTVVVALRGTPAYLALVDTADFTRVRWSQLSGRTTGHHWLSGDGRYTFVGVEGQLSGSVGVVDNRSGETLAQYPYPVREGSTTPARPHGVFHDAEPLKG